MARNGPKTHPVRHVIEGLRVDLDGGIYRGVTLDGERVIVGPDDPPGPGQWFDPLAPSSCTRPDRITEPAFGSAWLTEWIAFGIGAVFGIRGLLEVRRG
jgi:hypothetical protein